MKNFKMSKLSIAVITAVGFLSGCGSSSTSNDDATNSLSGNVADGYLVGAKVCIDRNQNSKCDDNEPTTKTIENGKFTLNNLTKQDITDYPILVEVDDNVIDEDNNQPVGDYYTLSANPGETFISPISTMVRDYVITNKVSYKEAEQKIASLLGVDNNISLLSSDYIKNNSTEAQQLHKQAQIIAQLKIQILKDLGNINYTTDAKTIDKYINDKIMDKLSMINTESNSNLDINNITSNILNYIDLSDKDNLNTQQNSTLADLLNKTTIKQNVTYTTTYNGGTDIKQYTIENSANKLCTMHILNTTNAYNPYGTSYKINFSDYSPTTTYNLGVQNTNNSFSISWMYGTTENSHLDFYVDCQPVTTQPQQTLAEKYQINIPPYTSVSYNTELFLTSAELGQNDNNRTVLITNNQNDFNNVKWSGVSLFVNDKIFKSYSSDENNTILPKQIDYMLFTYDKDTKEATCILKDKDGNILSTLKETNISLDATGSVNFGYFMGKINNNSSTLIYTEDSYSTLKY